METSLIPRLRKRRPSRILAVQHTASTRSPLYTTRFWCFQVDVRHPCSCRAQSEGIPHNTVRRLPTSFAHIFLCVCSLSTPDLRLLNTGYEDKCAVGPSPTRTTLANREVWRRVENAPRPQYTLTIIIVQATFWGHFASSLVRGFWRNATLPHPCRLRPFQISLCQKTCSAHSRDSLLKGRTHNKTNDKKNVPIPD